MARKNDDKIGTLGIIVIIIATILIIGGLSYFLVTRPTVGDFECFGEVSLEKCITLDSRTADTLATQSVFTREYICIIEDINFDDQPLIKLTKEEIRGCKNR